MGMRRKRNGFLWGLSVLLAAAVSGLSGCLRLNDYVIPPTIVDASTGMVYTSGRGTVSHPSEPREQKVGFIKVDFDETLSHYAEWSGQSLNELRRLNGIRQTSSSLRLNRKIKIPFSRTTPEAFADKRQEFHKAVQEDFFNSFRVEKILIRNVKKGETLWVLCNKIYDIPIWLLGNFNPDRDMTALAEGDPIIIPIVIPVNGA